MIRSGNDYVRQWLAVVDRLQMLFRSRYIMLHLIWQIGIWIKLELSWAALSGKARVRPNGALEDRASWVQCALAACSGGRPPCGSAQSRSAHGGSHIHT